MEGGVSGDIPRFKALSRLADCKSAIQQSATLRSGAYKLAGWKLAKRPMFPESLLGRLSGAAGVGLPSEWEAGLTAKEAKYGTYGTYGTYAKSRGIKPIQGKSRRIKADETTKGHE